MAIQSSIGRTPSDKGRRAGFDSRLGTCLTNKFISMDIQVFNYNGNDITFRNDGSLMINATQMAKPFGKEAKHWLINQSTNDFLAELSKVRNLTFADLVNVRKGSPDNGGGTWMHEDVAIEFARWLSPAFAVWCNDRIKELMKVGMTATPATLEAMINDPELVIALATKVKELRKANEEQKELLLAQGEIITAQGEAISNMLPKVSYLEQILQNKSTVCTTQIAQDYGMSAKKFNIVLRNFRIQRKVGGQWILYSRYSDKGYVHSSTFTPENSKTGRVIMLTKWTQQGRIFLYEMLKDKGILPLIERDTAA